MDIFSKNFSTSFFVCFIWNHLCLYALYVLEIVISKFIKRFETPQNNCCALSLYILNARLDKNS